MKTPIQELIDEINQQIDLLIEKQFEVESRLEDIRWQSVYDGMIKSLGDVESMLKTRYLKKEKEVIERAYTDGIYKEFTNNVYMASHMEEVPEEWQKWSNEYYTKYFNTKE